MFFQLYDLFWFCGLYYQRVQEFVTGMVKSPEVSQATSLVQSDIGLNDGLKHLNTLECSDIIDQFRRVQLVSADDQDELDSETELSTVLPDQRSTEQTDVMSTNSNAYASPLHKKRSHSTSGEGTTDESLTRPRSTYADLIRQALSNSQNHQLSLPQIYHAIELIHPFYKSHAQTFGWQTSVRRTLERDPSFRKIDRVGVSPVWELKPKASVTRKRSLRSRPMPIQSSAASASPLHLFDMSAALLSHVEQNQDH
ncbi:MAG: hypothetical protein Q9168_002744 [Polycauliona sp. 1 TL-2023]